MIHDLSQSNIFTQHEIIIKVIIIPQEVLAARFSLDYTLTYDRSKHKISYHGGYEHETSICDVHDNKKRERWGFLSKNIIGIAHSCHEFVLTSWPKHSS